MARLLMGKGYEEVWPLLGGFDEWRAQGYPVELLDLAPPLVSAISPADSSA
jgi:3-mercaptopyruvate sulfurtransferase SseA